MLKIERLMCFRRSGTEAMPFRDVQRYRRMPGSLLGRILFEHANARICYASLFRTEKCQVFGDADVTMGTVEPVKL